MSKIVDMCEECKKKNGWKFCPYSGEELKQEQRHESKQSMSQDEFDEIFLGMLKEAGRVVWLNHDGHESVLPTCRFELRNSKDEWMFDINLDSKNPHFWFAYFRVLIRFGDKYGRLYEDVKRLMKNQLKLLFNLCDVTPIGRDE